MVSLTGQDRFRPSSVASSSYALWLFSFVFFREPHQLADPLIKSKQELNPPPDEVSVLGKPQKSKPLNIRRMAFLSPLSNNGFVLLRRRSSLDLWHCGRFPHIRPARWFVRKPFPLFTDFDCRSFHARARSHPARSARLQRQVVRTADSRRTLPVQARPIRGRECPA